MSISLAIKYRPTTWDDVTEQGSTKQILRQQLETNTFKHAYLFCGPAGCGKTTCARIFANDINNGEGNPIELDAASHNGVDDARNLIQQSKTKSLDSEYKVFIIDECHALSSSAWQAMLKIIEEPPAKSIFIFCTTDPQKIPATILSRVQRYDFQRISLDGIVHRLKQILHDENIYVTTKDIEVISSSVEYIAKIADGGMRDAITLLDKCLSYSKILTLENVVKALETANYDDMFKLLSFVLRCSVADIIQFVEQLYASGVDLRQFSTMFMEFVIEVLKYVLNCDWRYINIPKFYEDELQKVADYDGLINLLTTLVKLNNDLKYSVTPKYDVESALILEVAFSDRTN